MQKQKLFKTWSCVRFCAPSVLYNYQSSGETLKQDAAKKVETPGPTPDTASDKTAKQGNAVLDEGKKAAEKFAALGDKLENMSPFKASRKLAKGLDYLSLKQNIPLDHEQLVNVLKDKGFLDPKYDSSQDSNALATTVNAIKAMQRKLGVKDDGEIGRNTFEAMKKKQPDIITALNNKAQQAEPAAAKREKPAEQPDLPAGEKAKIEVKLSQVSDALQMNYKTAARLHDNLFNTDGTFKQSPNADDLMAYKTALDNISGQLKTVETIEDGLHDYKVPVDFTLTITNQHGETSSPRALVCTVHNTFGIPRANLFATDSGVGVTRFFDYRKMQDNFEKRLAELKGDYDRIVNEWAKKVAGETGRTGDETMQARFDEMFEGERTPPVLALLEKKNEDFQGDVLDEAGTILAKRNEKEDKEMADAKAKAEKDVKNAEIKAGETTATVQRINAEIQAAEKANSTAKKQAADARTVLETAQAGKSKNLSELEFAAQSAEQAARETASILETAKAKDQPARQELAQAEKNLEQKQQELAALTAPNPRAGAAAAD